MIRPEDPNVRKDRELLQQFEDWMRDRVQAMANEEIQLARERMESRIPELAAEIGVRIQQMLADTGRFEAVLQILIRPKLH